MHNELTESLEKYLLAIYEITKENSAPKVKDVSNYLKIGGPATSDAIKTLSEKKYINYVPYGTITITHKGIVKIEDKIKRHDVIASFLENVLMIEKSKIEDNVSKIEYAMPDDIMERFIKFLNFMQNCTCKEPKWVKSYKYYLQNEEMDTTCIKCAKSGQLSVCSKSCCN
jgi:DtxR family Mn-dependent transcriptional regulator